LKKFPSGSDKLKGFSRSDSKLKSKERSERESSSRREWADFETKEITNDFEDKPFATDWEPLGITLRDLKLVEPFFKTVALCPVDGRLREFIKMRSNHFASGPCDEEGDNGPFQRRPLSDSRGRGDPRACGGAIHSREFDDTLGPEEFPEVGSRSFVSELHERRAAKVVTGKKAQGQPGPGCRRTGAGRPVRQQKVNYTAGSRKKSRRHRLEKKTKHETLYIASGSGGHPILKKGKGVPVELDNE